MVAKWAFVIVIHFDSDYISSFTMRFIKVLFYGTFIFGKFSFVYKKLNFLRMKIKIHIHCFPKLYSWKGKTHLKEDKISKAKKSSNNSLTDSVLNRSSKKKPLFEWLTPIKRQDLKFGLIFLKNDHTVILEYFNMKEWTLSNFAFQSF